MCLMEEQTSPEGKQGRQQTRRRGANKERGQENEQDEDRLGSAKKKIIITISCLSFLLYIKVKTCKLLWASQQIHSSQKHCNTN